MPNGELLRRLERVIGTSKENMRRISGMLRAGEIDINGWERGMRHQLRFQAKYSAALGGNTTDLTFQMYGKVGAELKKQYGYLDNFKSKLVELQKADPEKFKEMLKVDARSELYAGQARAHYFNTARYAGLLEKVRWVLTTAENCEDCVRLAAGGPYTMGVDLNQVPGDGSTICRTNCGCYLEPAE